MAKNNYICPHCEGYLNLGEDIIFSTKLKSGTKGLIALHTEVGDYSEKHHPSYHFEKGEKLEFHCPICNAKLASEKDKDLAKIIMEDEQERRFDVYFSPIAGEKSTYIIVGESVKAFGDDSDNYLDFFNLSQMT